MLSGTSREGYRPIKEVIAMSAAFVSNGVAAFVNPAPIVTVNRQSLLLMSTDCAFSQLEWSR